MEAVTTSVGGILASITALITTNLTPILTVAGILLGAVVVWRLVRRFVK
jgi:hypothetical protein